MTQNRQLTWDGCNNVRDLGGLSASGGRRTRWGALVRSDAPSKLTAEGWRALWAHGIRTILTLRTAGHTEQELDLPVLPPGIESVSVPIEDLNDKEFLHKWAASELWCTPLYYQDALQRWPQQHAEVVAAFARAQAGGVLFHCVRGHDRTGIIAILLLALAGVTAEEIINDYELSPDPERDQILEAHGTSSRKVILDVLGNMDIEDYFLSAGLSQADIEAARQRLIEPADQT
jgi:protein tyrosine/serine phosphatase